MTDSPDPQLGTCAKITHMDHLNGEPHRRKRSCVGWHVDFKQRPLPASQPEPPGTGDRCNYPECDWDFDHVDENHVEPPPASQPEPEPPTYSQLQAIAEEQRDEIDALQAVVQAARYVASPDRIEPGDGMTELRAALAELEER